MSATDPAGNRLGPLVYFSTNWISVLGVLLTTTGGVAWLFTLPLQLSGENVNPYLGLLTAFALPIVFFAGLALIPLGIRLQQRKARAKGVYPETFPKPDWANARFRQLVSLIGLATAANVVIGGHLTYSAVEEMDTVSFCGQTCHIMQPEFTAFQHAPHANLACVDCHIGEGVESYVAAKVNGAKQLIEVLTNTFPTPVPTPVHNLAQGSLTCEKCHSDQDLGTKRREWIQFEEDEANSATRTELLIKVGGHTNPTGAHGAHLANGAVIEYRSDPKREHIPWIRSTAPDGTVTEYAVEEWDSAEAERFELRTMDCTDCHNRAAHSFENPGRALDQALANGVVDASLPFVKREGLRLLTIDYADRAAAEQEIPAGLAQFYRAYDADLASARGADIQAAGAALVAIYQRNIFPEFKVAWGTHPNQFGHIDSPGCFRCHDRDHRSLDAAKQPIGAQCSSCHEMRTVKQPISAPSVPLLTRTQTTREAVPASYSFSTSLGPVDFDHAKHVDMAKGDCTACHNKLFAMSRGDLSFGGGDGHLSAEQAGVSCAGCHVSGGEAFSVQGSCRKCHTNLSAPRAVRAAAPVASGRLPGRVEYPTKLGVAWFDHAQHVDLVKDDCSSCHNTLFPMASGTLGYAEDLHRAAEAAKTSCAGCHVEGGTAFSTDGQCAKCHTGLGELRVTPVTGRSGIPQSPSVATRLGAAKFGHRRHVELADGDCTTCHNKIFPLAKGMLGYKDDLHRTAEDARTSCGACHVEGGTAFPSQDNCTQCHVDLSASVRGSDLGLPEKIVYANRLGDVPFDHDEHIRDAEGDCTACHNQVFPMAKGADLEYDTGNYHRGAEQSETSCAACHHPGGESFESIENCNRCHQSLELPNKASLPWAMAFLLFFVLPASSQTPDSKNTRTAGSGYVGAKRCAVCHQEQAQSLERSPHVVVRETARLEAQETLCESCHGPGLEHVLALDPAKLTDFGHEQPARVNRACLNCHSATAGFANHFFDEHARNGVECTACHSVHQATGQRLRAAESDALCSSCHADVRAEFNRPFRHKLAEGAVHCVDCHNPHGQAPGAKLARVFANETSCVRCHGDKRGPFPFEHAPVRLEPCTSCHEPHGSSNPRMLARHQIGQLCLECHSMLDSSLGGVPPAFHDVRSARFRSCTGCHTKIHGSYVSRDFLR